MSNFIFRQLFGPIGLFPGKTSRKKNLSDLVDLLKVIPIQDELLRFGPNHDGGYLMPDVLDGVDYCFSQVLQVVVILNSNWQTEVSKFLWQINRCKAHLLFIRILTLLNFIFHQIIPL